MPSRRAAGPVGSAPRASIAAKCSFLSSMSVSPEPVARLLLWEPTTSANSHGAHPGTHKSGSSDVWATLSRQGSISATRRTVPRILDTVVLVILQVGHRSQVRDLFCRHT